MARLLAGNAATCDGIIRGHDGNFVLAWSANLGNCSLTTAELLVVLLGFMQIDKNLQIRNLCLEVDSRCVCHFISLGVLSSHVHAPPN